MKYAIALLAACSFGCATTAPPSISPPSSRGTQIDGLPRTPLLPVELKRVPPQTFARVAGEVEAAMIHAHGAARTTSSFVPPATSDVIGQVGWSSRKVTFAMNGDVIGHIDREVGCGPDVLRLSWRTLPVGREWTGTEIESNPQWWGMGEAWVRVGATELVGVAVDARDADCTVWGVLVDGTATVDKEFKSPGFSGPTAGSTVDVFGEDTNLVVAPTAVTVTADAPIVEITPTFQATCAHVRWASDLMGRQTLRARFSNGPQQEGCTSGDISEEFAHTRGTNGELARTERIRREPTGSEREDYVVRTVGVGRLVWEGITTTASFVEDGCEATVQTSNGHWTLKHPTQPDRIATARRTRTDTTCTEAPVAP